VTPFVILSALTAAAVAQPAATDIDNFGTQDGIDLWIPASEFMGQDGQWGGSPPNTPPGYFYWTGNGGLFWAYVPLPQGAYVDLWRVFYYDGSNKNDLIIKFGKFFDDVTGSPNPTFVAFGTFASDGMPGFANAMVSEGRTIDLREPSAGRIGRNQAADFYVLFLVLPPDDQLRFKGVRVFWHRQVSPATAVAAFSCVPC